MNQQLKEHDIQTSYYWLANPGAVIAGMWGGPEEIKLTSQNKALSTEMGMCHTNERVT